MRGVFVTGTDTEAGKTVLAAAICAAANAKGISVAAFKPVVTGLDEPVGAWPRDHELLAAVANAGQSPEDSFRPVTTGLKVATERPWSTPAAQMAAATTLLPTSVSVPVTNTPRMRG